MINVAIINVHADQSTKGQGQLELLHIRCLMTSTHTLSYMIVIPGGRFADVNYHLDGL